MEKKQSSYNLQHAASFQTSVSSRFTVIFVLSGTDARISRVGHIQEQTVTAQVLEVEITVKVQAGVPSPAATLGLRVAFLLWLFVLFS